MKRWRYKGVFLAAAILTAGMIAGCGGSSSSQAVSSQTATAESISVSEENTEAVTESVAVTDAEPESESLTEVETELHADEETAGAEDAQVESSVLEGAWTDTGDLAEAIADSGVDFIPPEEDHIGGFEEMVLQGYRSMTGTIEADYSNGTDEVIVRKSADVSAKELEGGLNEYSHTWEEEVMGVTITCEGDGSKINTATFATDEYNYCVICNPGRAGNGMDADALQKIIQFMQ